MKNELYHSDKYLGQDFSDGIKHYKYIKREMKNGRWVYYYKDDLTKKAQKNLKKARNVYYDKYNEQMRKKSKLNKVKTDVALNKKISESYTKSRNEAVIEQNKTKWYQLAKKNALRKQLKRIEKQSQKHEKNAYYDKLYTDYNKQRYDASKKETKQAGKKWDKAYKNLEKAKNKDKIRKTLAKGAIKAANTMSTASYNTKQAIKKGKKKLDTKVLNELSKKQIKYGTTTKINETGGETIKSVNKSNKIFSEGLRSSTRSAMSPKETRWNTQNVGLIDQAIDKRRKKLYKKLKKKYDKSYGEKK